MIKLINRFFNGNIFLSSIFIILFAFGLPFKGFFVLNLLFLFIVYFFFFLLFFFIIKGIFLDKRNDIFKIQWALLFLGLSIMMLFLLLSNTIWRFASTLIASRTYTSDIRDLISLVVFLSMNLLYFVWFFKTIIYSSWFVPILWNLKRFLEIKFFNDEMFQEWCSLHLKKIFIDFFEGIIEKKKYVPISFFNSWETCEDEIFFSFYKVLAKSKKIYRKRKNPKSFFKAFDKCVKNNPFMSEILFFEDF